MYMYICEYTHTHRDITSSTQILTSEYHFPLKGWFKEIVNYRARAKYKVSVGHFTVPQNKNVLKE